MTAGGGRRPHPAARGEAGAPAEKDPRLLVRSADPLNAEPPAELLAASFITPVPLFFVRNHAPAPAVDPAAYRLTVDGLVRRPRTYTLDELRSRFPETTVVATLQCAGNRRRELMAVRPIPDEIPWDAQAIGTAAWTGVRLRDVLEDAGVDGRGRHVEFVGLDAVEKGGRLSGFGGSIPLAKAVRPEVLLAYGMNGAPLTPPHGRPLRAVVPGYIGARSVKWLAAVTVRADPSRNYFQAHAYKMFPPHVTAESADWEAGEMLGEVALTSVICSPADGARVPAGPVRCRGYALGGRHPVARVEVSPDGGRRWAAARLESAPAQRGGEGGPWAWVLWEAVVELGPGPHELAVRAIDASGAEQPETPAQVWNFKGYMNAARHRITVHAG